jgi:hypothetical protein
MRLVFRIDLNRVGPCAALCAAAVALSVLPAGVNAQEPAQLQSATLTETADAGSASLTGTTLAVASSPNTTAPEIRQLAGDVLNIPADAASVNDISLDDQVLSRQRGGAVGMLMVAATPQLMHGNSGSSVTLWDEIAPPSPLPIPVAAQGNVEGNVANYQRK